MLSQIEDSVSGISLYEHDLLGTLTRASYSDGNQELRLPDAVGNLFESVAKTDRQYGPGGQLLESKHGRYQYDAEGNLIEKITKEGEVWHYEWAGNGLLTRVVRPDGAEVDFNYDALGRRVSKSYKGKITQWVWEANKPLHEWVELSLDGHNTEQVITWLFEEGSFAPIGKLQGTTRHSILTDHLGTPLEMVDQSGRTQWSAQTTAYGRVRLEQGTRAECPFRFQGQYEDVETGLYYNRFRYYDPQEGTYVSQDPIRLLSGSPLYSYVRDTTASLDLFGLSCSSDAAELRANMVAAGVAEPPYKNAAHHIVMSNSTDPRMVTLRNHLNTHGIGVNQNANGVFLANSTATKTANAATEISHSRIHTDAYKQAVHDRVISKTNKADIESELDSIRTEILSGVFTH